MKAKDSRQVARARAETQLRDTVKTLAAELPQHPERPVGALFADLFCALPGLDVPDAVRRAARGAAAARADAGARRTFFAVVTKLWSFLLESGALDEGRARVLAERLAPCADLPALLFFFECDAREHQLDAACRAFAAELDARHPAFRRRRGTAPMDQALMEALGVGPGSRPGLEVAFHPNGNLASLGLPGENGPRLTLEAQGGRGHFTHTGKRGGYGFCVDEHFYERSVHSTLYSPWHDGCQSSEPGEWVRWVLQCAGTVLAEADRAASTATARRARAR